MYKRNQKWNKCDVCGQFVAYIHFEVGAAVRRMIIPDNGCSSEQWETLCVSHSFDIDSIDPEYLKLNQKLNRIGG